MKLDKEKFKAKYVTNFEADFLFQTNISTKPENVKPDKENPEAKGCTNSETNIQTVSNLIDVFNESVIDIRLGEDETNLKAEMLITVVEKMWKPKLEIRMMFSIMQLS